MPKRPPPATPTSSSSDVSGSAKPDEEAIGLVMAQTNCSRAVAIMALEKSGGDVVDALLVISSLDESKSVEQEVDNSSIEAKAELVMVASGCSQSVALRALRRCDGDVVNALLSLSSVILEAEEYVPRNQQDDASDSASDQHTGASVEGEVEEDLDDMAFASRLGEQLRVHHRKSVNDAQVKVLAATGGLSKRDMLADELLSSEVFYVSSLHALKTIFVHPMLLWLSSSSVAPMFNNSGHGPLSDMEKVALALEAIIPVNESLLRSLETKMSSWSADTTLGDVFSGMSAFEDTYRNFICVVQDILPRLDEYEKIAAFNQQLKVLRSTEDSSGNAVRRLDFRSYLIMPVQRIPRYQLFLKDLLKVTDMSHSDFALLKSALTACEICNREVNKNLADVSNAKRMVTLNAQFNGDPQLAAPGRLLEKEGLLQKECSNHKLAPRKVFLFNDLIAYAKPFGQKFKLCEKIPLRSAKVLDQPDSDKFGFLLKSPSKSFVLYADSLEDKMEWMLAITNGAAKLVEKERPIAKSPQKK